MWIAEDCSERNKYRDFIIINPLTPKGFIMPQISISLFLRVVFNILFCQMQLYYKIAFLKFPFYQNQFWRLRVSLRYL